ncbi:MAG: ABC transporter ATP-binding protein [Deltaproteobacteria bacterium]|nr:ABC transporter ATP-binding protein [Deltaproteobacteria bacterium]MBI4373923.1 ABC transporter ATP-binding protein [Deltaproteobacteria bacterium]
MSQTVIELKGLGKRFGSHWVLNHINLTIGPGESVALFGGNGSGKSTLLKILATLLSPSRGSVALCGADATRQKREIREILRYLAHEKQLYGTLTVRETLRFTAGLRQLTSKAAEEGMNQVMERLQLNHFADKRVSHLSEGMKKRVVLGRLLFGIDQARMILLDEPHPTLDQEGRRILDEMIVEWKKKGKTILIASHDHAEALLHADRLLILEEGGLVYDGPPKGSRS